MELTEQRVADGAQKQFCVERAFSAIAGLQSAHTLRYEVKADGPDWVLCLTARGGGAERQESERITASRELAFGIRDVLYENAVPIENWKDVLDELLDAGAAAPEQRKNAI